MRNKQGQSQTLLIDGLVLARVFRQFAALLAQNEQLLNDVNVFPVPDSDTGTNSLLTIHAGLAHIDKGKKDASAVASHMATDAGASARGNSGVILAEFLRGIAQSESAELDSQGLQAALTTAAELAQQSVAVPREGTMLTVAQAASAVNPPDELTAYAAELARTARETVIASTSQLDELRAAGVVDAGAMVLSFFFDALHEVVSGTKLPAITLAQTTCDVDAIDYRGPEFEVMFNFKGDAQSLREELIVMGESLTVSGPATNSRFHIHADNPTEIILEAMRHGMASRIDIQNLRGSVEVHSQATAGVGVVIALEGRGLVDQATALGAQCVNLASDPSIAEFESAIRAVGKHDIIVLPSALDSQAVASIAAHNLRAEGLTVKVIPTRTVPHSLAALAVFDKDQDVQANISSMTRAAQTTRTGCVLKNSSGEIEGFIDGVLFETSATTSANDMLAHVVDSILSDGGELVTVLVGADGTADSHVHLIADHVGVDFDFIAGGQSTSTYLVGVE